LRKIERRNSNQKQNRFGLKASLYARTIPFKGCLCMINDHAMTARRWLFHTGEKLL